MPTPPTIHEFDQAWGKFVSLEDYDALDARGAELVATLEAIIREGRSDIARAGEGHCAGLTFAIAQAEQAIAALVQS